MNIFVIIAILTMLSFSIIGVITDKTWIFVSGTIISTSMVVCDIYKIECTGELKTNMHNIYYVEDIPAINSEMNGIITVQSFSKVPIKSGDVVLEEYKIFFDGIKSTATYKIIPKTPESPIHEDLHK